MGIDFTVSSTLKKPSKDIFILRHFRLFLIHLQSKNKATLGNASNLNSLAQRLGLRPGNMSQNDPKTASLMMSLTKNLHPSTNKIFFECQLEDWPIRLSHWTALQCNRRRSYGIGKATENCCFQAKMQVRIYWAPALKV